MVNYREQVANEATRARENSGSDGGDERATVDQIEVDFASIPFVKFYPTTAITGTFPENEGNPIIRFPDEENNGHRHQGYLGLVLDDVSIDTSSDGGFDMSEATFVKTDDDDYTEYRAVNFDDTNTVEKFGGEAVSIDGDQYGIEDTVTEIDGRVILVVDRTAAVSVAKKLDRNGATPADMDEATGSPNSGLIEYAPDDADAEVSWRYARRPELREGLLGSEVTVLVSRREEIDDETTGYLGQDESTVEPVLGYPTDENGNTIEETHRDENRASYAELVAADEARGMMWYSVFDEDGTALTPVEGEATERAYLEWRFDPEAGYLPDEQWEFVQEYPDELDTDEETILENVRANFDDANEERIVELVQNGAGQ